jgi:hypothetical protein
MVALTASAQERNPIGSLFLEILLCFTLAKSDRMFGRTLAAELDRFVERPWSDLPKGKEMTGPLLARVLRHYGVRSKTMWIAGEAAKGYLMTDLEDAFRRYIPRSEWEALKAEWRTEAEGRKSVDGEPNSAVNDEKSQAADPPPQAGTTPGDHSAAA